MSEDRSPPSCAGCAHFRNDPAFLESAFNGLASLSSGYASVVADDGLCLHHDRLTSARSWCAAFRRAVAALTHS